MSAFESTLERDFMFLLDYADEVEYFEEQYIRIQYRNEAGRSVPYTPDVFVRFKGVDSFLGRAANRPWLVEVKYDEYLKAHAAELKRPFQAAVEECQTRGWYFRVFTERDIRNAYLQNVSFLRGYKGRNLDCEAADQILAAMSRLRCPTPSAVLTCLSSSREVKVRLLPVIWQLVADGYLQADLNFPLSMAIPIARRM